MHCSDTLCLQLPASYLNGPCVSATGTPDTDAREIMTGKSTTRTPHGTTTPRIPQSSSAWTVVASQKNLTSVYYCTCPLALDYADKRLGEACTILSDPITLCGGLTIRSPNKSCEGQRSSALPRKAVRSAGNTLLLTANKEHCILNRAKRMEHRNRDNTGSS